MSGISHKNVKLFPRQGNKDLRELYPELKDEPEFIPLDKEELWFVNEYANQTSDYYYHTPLQNKISKCFDRSFVGANPSKKEQYLSRAFPLQVKAAIDRMRLYNPDVRSQGLSITKDIFTEYKGIIDRRKKWSQKIDNKNKIDPTPEDLQKDKLFVDTSAKIIQELPDLMKRIENGFGIKVTEDSRADDDEDEQLFKRAFQ